MIKIIKGLRKPVTVTLVLLLICGFIYPLLMTGISQLFFPKQANGSLLTANGKIVGSELIGQDFTDVRFMKCRPSAVDYNTYTEEDKANGDYAGPGSGSNNYSAGSPELIQRATKDIEAFLRANPEIKREDIPTDLLTASGSGLDPHISPASAVVQIPALAEATGLTAERLKDIVKENTKGKFLGIFGEEAVNVLMVNLEIAKELG